MLREPDECQELLSHSAIVLLRARAHYPELSNRSLCSSLLLEEKPPYPIATCIGRENDGLVEFRVGPQLGNDQLPVPCLERFLKLVGPLKTVGICGVVESSGL